MRSSGQPVSTLRRIIHLSINSLECRTSGENIGDSGIIQAFRAWQAQFNSSSKEGHEYLLPALNYTREQLFFIAFGQIWAENIKPASLVRLLLQTLIFVCLIQPRLCLSRSLGFVRILIRPISSALMGRSPTSRSSPRPSTVQPKPRYVQCTQHQLEAELLMVMPTVEPAPREAMSLLVNYVAEEGPDILSSLFLEDVCTMMLACYLLSNRMVFMASDTLTLRTPRLEHNIDIEPLRRPQQFASKLASATRVAWADRWW